MKAAQNEGAIAVVMVNNVAGAPVTMGGTDNSITIPAVMVSQADGARLAGQLDLGAAVQLTLRPPVQLDGDFDSGIMAHEYGHGISNRLTSGGPNTSCLSNAEQAGEGWSDFFALMMTTDWTSTPLTDGPTARPMGNYVQGQGTTGGGIRRYPYSTSLAVNPLTYANVATNTEVHAIGEIWAATLWDMTWNIIQQQGNIEPNLYNSASTGGNAVALNLVMQGMKLQPCEPGFLDGRDAILAADSLLYGGRYHCAIWSAFARRGMGYSAREGSSNSATDQTPASDLPGVRLSRNTVPMTGNQFAVNLTATCECQTPAPVSITDQLPTGLQYVSSTGGTLSGSTVSFPGLSFAQGQQRTFQIVAQTAPGAGCALTLPVNDDRDANTAGGFTPAVVTSGGGNAWAPTTVRARSGSAWAAGDPNTTSDITLTSAAFTPGAFAVLSFYHYFNSEARYDGGMVAISVNNGAWQDANALFLQNGYNSVFATGTASAGSPCFAGKMPDRTGAAAFQQSLVDLSSFSGQSIRVRFQFQSDNLNPYSNALPGWFVDDIQVLSGCGGLQQVQLLSSANAVLGSYARPTFLLPLPAPVITVLSPNSGPVGTGVTITGTDLTGATGLTLNGAAITGFTVVNGTTITFTVPAGATTGLLTVTTAGGTSNGLTFTVTAPSYPDLTISTGTPASPTAVAAGTYNSITVTSTGVAALSGSTVVNTALTVQSGGTLDMGCQPLTGAGSFTLAAGATLRICDPAGISASGATGAVRTTGARSFAADASYVYTSPDANPQATGSGLPATVRNLTNATTGGLVLTQPVGIVQVLALPTASNLNLNGQALTLLSDASGTALIANTGGSVTGSTGTLQRHIETNTAASGYRHYASPMVAGAGAETLATLAAPGYAPDFSGAAAYNSSATPGLVTPFPTVFGYNQDRIAGLNSTYGTFDKGWQAALGTEVPQVGRGYAVQAPGAALVDFTGTFTTGSVSRSNLQRASADPATGWHLLGNPFPSPLDWSTMTVGTTSADNLQNMDGAMYVYQSSGPYAGSYRTYLGGAPGAASPIIPAGAGFFVHTTSAATPGTVRMAGNNRVTTFGAQPAFGRNAADPRPQLVLELRGPAGRDALTVYADPAATAGVDAALDALKLPNPSGLNLAALAGTSPLAIHALPAFPTGTVVPLTVGVPAAGAYTLAVNELLNLPAGTAAVLVDTQLNTRTDLSTLPAAGYAFTANTAQATAGLTGRFYLNLAAGPLATAAGRGAATLALFPNPAHGGAATLTGAAPGTLVTVFDAVGRAVTSAPADAKGTATLALPAGLATGVYVVRAGTQALRLTVE